MAAPPLAKACVGGKLAVGPMVHRNAARCPFHAASVTVEIKYSWVGTRLWRGRRSEETLHLLKTLHLFVIFMRETERDAYEADDDA
jgi:hypothetical protein